MKQYSEPVLQVPIFIAKPDKPSWKAQKMTREDSGSNLNERALYDRAELGTKRALIVHPGGWLKKENFEFKTHGLQIEFLRNGLVRNGFKVRVIEDGLLDKYKISSQMEESDFIFFWSLSSLHLASSTMATLRSLKKIESKSSRIIGVISASPTQKLFEKCQGWDDCLDGVVYYEEFSEFRDRLTSLFRVYHFPLLQYSVPPGGVLSNEVNLHFSGSLKYNRRDWLIAARAACLKLDIQSELRIFPENNARRNLPYINYKSEEDISQERTRFSLGLNLTNREPGVDALLIGSFWDYYRNGCVPIVVGHQTRFMSSYLHPHIDYFPVENEQDLYDVLFFAKMNSSKITEIRTNILSRMHSEFTPFSVINKFLLKLDVTDD